MLRLVLFLSTLPLARSACKADFDLFKDGECRGRGVNGYACSPGPRDNDCGHNCIPPLTPFMIRNDDDQSYWAKRASDDDTRIVLAIFCNTVTKRWEWHDGSPVDYKPPLYDDDLQQDCAFNDGSKRGGFMIMPQDGTWRSTTSFGSAVVYCAGRVDRLPVRGDGLTQNPEDGLLYQIDSAPKSWQDAQDACEKQGAELASIHNQQANEFIRQLATSNKASNGLFLGGSVKEDNLTWSDGSEWDYSNADPECLSSKDGKCIAMDTFSHTGRWVAPDCATKLPYACVKADPMLSGPWEAGKDITSPGYPYDASIPADYLLSVPTGFVEVTIEELQANSCCDYLILSDEEIGGELVARLTGQLLPENRDKNKFTSKSNFMKVSWQPKGGNSMKGFRLTYRSMTTYPTTAASTIKASTEALKTSSGGNIIPRLLLGRQQVHPQQLSHRLRQ